MYYVSHNKFKNITFICTMKKIIQFLVTLPLIGFAQSWVPATPFPFDGVHHPITFANDSFAYVVCGSNTNNVYKYTKSSDSWTQLANFPGGNRGYAYGVAIHNKAYMGFGSDQFSNYYNDWWEFDMTTESWPQLASLPGLGRNHAAMVATSDKILWAVEVVTWGILTIGGNMMSLLIAGLKNQIYQATLDTILFILALTMKFT